MAFTVPTWAALRDRYLHALVNQRPDAAIGVDSDNYVRACAIAAVLEDVYAHQSWVLRQAFADLADPDYMEKMANQRGIRRRAAIAASGTIRFSGLEGVNIPVGQQVFTESGIYYTTTEALLIGAAGTVEIPATAVVPGAGGNLTAAAAVTVSIPPTNIDTAATVLSMTGGTDTETDDVLLERLLLRLQEEAQGGNETDYKRWTLEVAGVERVYVFDARRGAGTVDVVPLPASGVPSTTLLGLVQEILDARRPIGMRPTLGVLALAPTQVLVEVSAEVAMADDYTLEGVRDQIEASVDTVFAALGPGDSLIRAQLVAAVMAVPGVADVTLHEPAANVTSSVTESTLEMVFRGSLLLS